MTGSDTAGVVPPRFNLARYCLGPAPHRDPHRPALVELGDPSGRQQLTWTYRELDEQVRAIATGLLETGVAPGARVVLRLGNRADTPLAYLAVMAAGLVAVPTSHLLTPEEAAQVTLDCQADLVLLADDLPMPIPSGVRAVKAGTIAEWRTSGRVCDYADTAAEDAAFVVYTSGTAATPKGVVHAHRSAWGRRPILTGWLGLGPDDVLLHAGALSWTYTLGVGLVDPWAAGATAVVYAGERPAGFNGSGAWWTLLAASRASVFAAVPGVYRQMLHGVRPPGVHLSALRHGAVAGEALTPALWHEWRDTTGLDLFEALGMSEISTFISSAPPGPGFAGVPTRPGSPGKPQPGRRVVALPVDGGLDPVPAGETGLLAVHRSDPGVMLGYWNRPAEDAAARRGEWFVSGDLVSFDADGYVHHHGRADDVMTSLGYRVSPLEVERALAAHRWVADVGVAETEVKDGLWLITAFIVATPDAPAPDALIEDVQGFAEQRLAGFKLPRRFVCVDALPRTPNGKIKRAELRTSGVE